ncbi:hypothetical protein SBDP1_600008 [Syntrophobacter sp. SbD1]|nr:hypothetical protein SBDP1_600008 [Syntrophobacter sp. SbD1]
MDQAGNESTASNCGQTVACEGAEQRTNLRTRGVLEPVIQEFDTIEEQQDPAEEADEDHGSTMPNFSWFVKAILRFAALSLGTLYGNTFLFHELDFLIMTTYQPVELRIEKLPKYSPVLRPRRYSQQFEVVAGESHFDVAEMGQVERNIFLGPFLLRFSHHQEKCLSVERH